MTITLLTLAFTTGLLAPVNPCGFALLPAYLTHTAAARPSASLPERVLRSLVAGAALAAGFALTLSAAGLAISTGAYQLIQAAPWLGFTVGLLLALLGLAGLARRELRLRLHLPTPRLRTRAELAAPIRWALFGVGYAVASLACTIAVLLAVITQAQADTTIASQLVVFGTYAAGSVTLLLVLSAAALAGSALIRWARTLARHQTRITAALLLVTGCYVAIYWWPAVTGHSPTGRGLPAIDRWSTSITSWLQVHTSTVAAAALALIIVSLTAAITARRRRRTQRPGSSCAANPRAPVVGRRASRRSAGRIR